MRKWQHTGILLTNVRWQGAQARLTNGRCSPTMVSVVLADAVWTTIVTVGKQVLAGGTFTRSKTDPLVGRNEFLASDFHWERHETYNK